MGSSVAPDQASPGQRHERITWLARLNTVLHKPRMTACRLEMASPIEHLHPKHHFCLSLPLWLQHLTIRRNLDDSAVPRIAPR